VVLLANHQTEADPGVFAHMLKDRWGSRGLVQDRGCGRSPVAIHHGPPFLATLNPLLLSQSCACRHPNMATDVIYVAGDRVVTDPLCKPFSMGRNL
jgi:glycerol-3-phosphate O-acyltransferase